MIVKVEMKNLETDTEESPSISNKQQIYKVQEVRGICYPKYLN